MRRIWRVRQLARPHSILQVIQERSTVCWGWDGYQWLNFCGGNYPGFSRQKNEANNIGSRGRRHGWDVRPADVASTKINAVRGGSVGPSSMAERCSSWMTSRTVCAICAKHRLRGASRTLQRPSGWPRVSARIPLWRLSKTRTAARFSRCGAAARSMNNGRTGEYHCENGVFPVVGPSYRPTTKIRGAQFGNAESIITRCASFTALKCAAERSTSSQPISSRKSSSVADK